MFAIVTIAGQQFKVRNGEDIIVHRLAGNVGDNVEFSNVLLTSNDNGVTFGGSTKVSAEILDHFKGEKALVFKKKRRKGYQKLNGHRQSLTRIKINSIA